MNRNFKYTLWLLALIITAALLAGCQAKKKSLDIQKQESSQESKVKKESTAVLQDNKSADIKTDEDYSAEETITADSIKVDKEGNTVYFNPKSTIKRKGSLQTQTKLQQNTKLSTAAKSDSTGKAAASNKSKVIAKDVKESGSMKFYGIAILILAVLVSLWYIKKQVKPVKDAVDLFI